MDYIMVHGFECPADVSPLARKALKKLSKKGIVIFEHDDGPGVLVRKELYEIAINIGLGVVQVDSHCLLLMTRKKMRKVRIKSK